jgi:hypothetical protein
MQEAARLMAAGDYEAALPVAMEAVALGEQLFKPQPALQLFPLYLLAAQVRAATPQRFHDTVGTDAGCRTAVLFQLTCGTVTTAAAAASVAWRSQLNSSV